MYPPARPRVFLCDDNQGLRATIRELLTDAGIEVVGEAVDGIDALRRVPPAAYEAPLVVLMDLRMPRPPTLDQALPRLAGDAVATVNFEE